jgi:hypothetical protein
LAHFFQKNPFARELNWLFFSLVARMPIFAKKKKKTPKLIKHWLTWKLELNEKVFSVHPSIHPTSARLDNYFQRKLVECTSPQSNLFTKTKQFEVPIVGMMHQSTWKHKNLPDELESPIMCFAVVK